MKYARWFFRFPGSVYAADIRLAEPGTEADARRAMRDNLRTARLPAGTEVWPAA